MKGAGELKILQGNHVFSQMDGGRENTKGDAKIPRGTLKIPRGRPVGTSMGSVLEGCINAFCWDSCIHLLLDLLSIPSYKLFLIKFFADPLTVKSIGCKMCVILGRNLDHFDVKTIQDLNYMISGLSSKHIPCQ